MGKKLTTIYAAACTLLLAVGSLLVFVFAFQTSIPAMVGCTVGLVLGFVFAPIFHELGHLAFASYAKMEWEYIKLFCFKFYRKEGKVGFGFASPFALDETQVLPKMGGNMTKRAQCYAIGGLALGGIFLFIVLIAAVLCTAFGGTSFVLWGMVPYAGYLFFLNLPPVEYASGKTDTLVYLGIKKGFDAEKTMLSAMEIQGQLYEGKSFAEIDKKFYFDLPQLCEDEPLFAVMLDLRYRYYLEKEEYDKAADCLNRLAQAQVYLSDFEVEKIAAELTYMHSLRKDFESAEESGQLCKTYLQLEEVSAKRVLLAFCKAFGKEEALAPLKAQANACLEKERILGVKKFEEILLSRI